MKLNDKYHFITIDWVASLQGPQAQRLQWG